MTAADDSFHAALALQDRSDEWKMRAIAGYTVRTVSQQMCPEDLPALNRNGMCRCLTEAEREAWTFGWTWPDREAS